MTLAHMFLGFTALVAVLFYLATIPQFMAAGVPPLLMGVLLAAVHGLCCLENGRPHV